MSGFLLPTLLDVVGAANKVIFQYVNESIKVVLRHTHIKNGIATIINVFKTSKSHGVRESCLEYLAIILSCWDTFVLKIETMCLHGLLHIIVNDYA